MVRVLPEANDEAAAISDAMAPPRAVRFDRAYAAALSRIAADPCSLPWHHEASSDETRFKLLDGFPYFVLFTTADPSVAVVLAVLHTSSGPARFAAAERRA